MVSEALRIGVIGVGRRGGEYARALADGRVEGARLAALSDPRSEALAPFGSCPTFREARSLVRSGDVDAVVVATPHRAHEEPALEAIATGLHLVVEKPLAVHRFEAARLVDAHRSRRQAGQLFATALVLRADLRYLRLRAMLGRGELGRVTRALWVVTDCLRSEAYFRGSSWRGTFRGEGGGLLLNQCLHQLDLWQWLFGMPRRVQAFCGFGRRHAIEVEDEVTAYFEHDAMTGAFIASSGEAPGTNRLEVAGDLGRVVIEGDSLEIRRNRVPTPEWLRTAAVRESDRAAEPERLALARGGLDPAGLLANLVRAARGEEPLFAPAEDGIASIELANALLWSALARRTVEFPLDERACAAALESAAAERAG